MRNTYISDIVKVDGRLFDTIETAIKTIENDWRTWIGVGKNDDEYSLIEVVYDDNGDITVRYFEVADYDDNDQPIMRATSEQFEVEPAQITLWAS